MSDFYDGQQPWHSERLDLGDGYDLYFEQSGCRDGLPVLYLHGGPGGGLDATMRRFHDPSHYRFVMFDQRGAGASLPAGDVRRNSTDLLLEDIERLRSALGIDGWIVSGGSWGSTLALAYAQAYPERCKALVLRGVFLGTRDETEWIASGLRRLFPIEWQDSVGYLDREEQDNLFAAIEARMCGTDTKRAITAARALARFEFLCASVAPDKAAIEAELTASYPLQYSRLLCHYARNDFFLEPDQLIRGIGRLSEIAGYIVQGQFDWICPPAAAV
jgi:proline iminopeptidase